MSLRPRLLHLQHTPLVAGHPGGRRMYATLRHRYYWPHMAADAYEFVKKCDRCARERISLRAHASKLKLFPAKAPLESVAIDIMGPLPISGRKNRYLLVIVDRYTKLVRTVPLASATAFSVAKAFCEQWATDNFVIRQRRGVYRQVFPGSMPHLGHPEPVHHSLSPPD